MTTLYGLSSSVLSFHHLTKHKKSISSYSGTLCHQLSPLFHAPRQLLHVTESINCPPPNPPIDSITAHHDIPRIHTIHVVPECGCSPNNNYTLSGWLSMGWCPFSSDCGGRSQHGDRCLRARRAVATCSAGPMIPFSGVEYFL